MTNIPIFVYGTLKSGQYNHERLGLDRVPFIGKAVTIDKYDLYDLGVFPGLCDGNTSNVKGECYSVSQQAFRDIDIMERYAGYKPRKIPVLIDGNRMDAVAWIYQEGGLGGTLIESGEWVLTFC